MKLLTPQREDERLDHETIAQHNATGITDAGRASRGNCSSGGRLGAP
jgi:hypothetical protein